MGLEVIKRVQSRTGLVDFAQQPVGGGVPSRVESRSALIVALRGSPAQAEARLDQGDDEQLMALVAAGSKAAFEILLGRYLPRLTNYCARFVGHAADELAQDIALEVWLRRDRYRSQGKFVVFLFTLARSRCLNRLRDDGRRQQRHLNAAAEAPTDHAAPDQLDSLLEQERQRRVRAALQALSPKLREAVVLRFDQGLDYGDIARILDCPEATARSRVYLAMQELRQQLDQGGSS